jgi:hypothetical protein
LLTYPLLHCGWALLTRLWDIAGQAEADASNQGNPRIRETFSADAHTYAALAAKIEGARAKGAPPGPGRLGAPRQGNDFSRIYEPVPSMSAKKTPRSKYARDVAELQKTFRKSRTTALKAVKATLTALESARSVWGRSLVTDRERAVLHTCSSCGKIRCEAAACGGPEILVYGEDFLRLAYEVCRIR